jgi:XTP/dITP diphosphohydrolase
MDFPILIRPGRFAIHGLRTGEFALSKTPLLIATSNEGKLRELRVMLSDLSFELVALRDFPDLWAVPETGSTFIENASLKATGYARQAGLMTLADDSGLEVRALGGAPGVLSARYLGEATSYAERNRALLAALKDAGDRSAQFVCAVAVAAADGRVLNVFAETCAGRIAESPRGSGGFGYDPIFIPDCYDQTFGELPPELKNRISHRARAIATVRDLLDSLTSAQTAG